MQVNTLILKLLCQLLPSPSLLYYLLMNQEHFVKSFLLHKFSVLVLITCNSNVNKFHTLKKQTVMKKTQEKKLLLSKVKVANLSKKESVKGRICVTSIEDTSCTTSSRLITRCDCF